MKVYFKQNFWAKREEGIPGIPKTINWKFTYDNEEYFIPTIYCFSEGITMDIISIIDNEKYKTFYDKYSPVEYELTEEESLLAEQEIPIPVLPLRSIYINGQLAEISSCASSYISFLHNKKKSELSKIKEVYKIDDKQSFHCTRVHAKYEMKDEIEELKILTGKTEELLPIRKHFTLEACNDEKQNDIVFKHPLTGTEHHIYLNNVEYHDAKKEFLQHDPDQPNNFAIIKYELVPPMPHDERLLIQEIKQEDMRNSMEYSSIGVIFHRDENEKGMHGQKLEYAFSGMYFKNLHYTKFSIIGIYKTKCHEMELIFK